MFSQKCLELRRRNLTEVPPLEEKQ
jgi:hypothetical protein